jgi:hypothetical protein
VQLDVNNIQQQVNKSDTDTYLGQRVHGVEVFSGQISNRVFLGKLGETPDSLVDIFFFHQLFRDASRIFQARIAPKVGKTML